MRLFYFHNFHLVIMEYTESVEELNKCSIDTPHFDFSNEDHLAKVVKVYDGDTVHVCFKHDGKYQQYKIRLYGIDCYEIHPSLRIPKNVREYIKKRGEMAKQRLEELVLNKNVHLHCKEQDMYGRILGIIKMDSTDNESINDLLIREGHGYIYDGGTKDITKTKGIPKYIVDYFDKQSKGK